MFSPSHAGVCRMCCIAKRHVTGAAPIYLSRSLALWLSGVDRYNASVKSQDEAAKTSGLEAAKQDFRDAAQAATKAVELVKAQTPPTDPAALKNFETNKFFALASRAEAMRLLVGKADPTQVDA